ncbi:MAG: glycoside hydrolase family 20 zincin-like fold domain-containing protein [Planctomycetota bacterium]|jgi:hypothetical protein|nr:glycoside hydrolase family 20 zincin-like fold domain-containing protein [Planctomycetota bacterium]
MQRLEDTLAGLSPGVASFKPRPGVYNPRKGLAVYFLPCGGPPLTSPGSVLGEALAGRSGLGCTMLEGVPELLPAGAVLVSLYEDLKRTRPDLVAGVPEPTLPGEYVLFFGQGALILAGDRDGLVHGMQTLSMIILRHGDSLIPGGIVQDHPRCVDRGIAIELCPGEISPVLVYQIVSFITTFKGNALDWILPDDFSNTWMRELTQVIQVTKSMGVSTTVRLPWLGKILGGDMGMQTAWSHLRTIARAFGASRAALDDPCPDAFDQETAERIVLSITNGDLGLDQLEVDLRFIERTGLTEAVAREPALACWRRMSEPILPPETGRATITTRIEVPGSFTGLSSASLDGFCDRLDAASEWLDLQEEKRLFVSFRNIGVSHAWQNYLPPVAAGLVMAWGIPNRARASVRSFTELLYGDAATEVTELWRQQDAAFPPGLSENRERRLREIGFGDWPDLPEDAALLAGIDWQRLVESINSTAEKLENVAAGLTRNKTTLVGSYLSLQLLAWLCRFSILMPEISRRRRDNFDRDGRTEPIANELMRSFEEWRDYLVRLQEESGLEIMEMEQIQSMGLRIKGLVDGIFE